MKRLLIAGTVGNVLEWYDFSLFGYFAPVLARLFFPHDDQLASLIDTFGIFAAGFLMRPIGAALFGSIGDRLGRRMALMLSVLVMAIPTCLIGLLPTYAQVGLAAPIALTVLRLLQGLSVGGEYTGSIAYLVESASPLQRGYIGSWTPFSATLGTILGSAVGALATSAISEESLYSWGWRLPFILGLLVGGVGLYLRSGIAESRGFEEVKVSGALAVAPVRDVVITRWAELLRAIGMNGLNSAAFYIVFVYLTTYLTTVLTFPMGTSLTINTLSLIVLTLILPVTGALSDRVGRKPLLMGSAVGLAVLSYPLFWLISHETVVAVFTAQLAFTALLALYFGPMPAVMTELFPTRERCSGISISYNVAAAIFGGSAPLIATYLMQVTGTASAPAIYIVLSSIVALLAMFKIPETAFAPLR